MVFEALGDPRILQGIVLAALGVGFWIGGLVVANWLWKRLRDGSGD